jgi:hypothetical protein
MKKKFKQYGLENELEMSIVPSTGKEIIDKKTVAEAVAESIQKASERNEIDNDKMEQIVTVLESIRASIDNEQNNRLAIAATNTVLNSNGINGSLTDSPISITKENIKEIITIIKSHKK